VILLVHDVYGGAVRNPWFPRLVVAFFVGHSVVGLIQTMVLTGALAGVVLIVIAVLLSVYAIIGTRSADALGGRRRAAIAAIVGAGSVAVAWVAWRYVPSLSLFAWGELLFSIVPAGLVLAGALRMPTSRAAAYRMFHRAVLILIFVTQFFAFYHDQFTAVIGLFANIIVLATLRYMIHEEARLEHRVR
jgi:hypothetical protein